MYIIGTDIFNGLAVSTSLLGKPKYVPAERIAALTEGRIDPEDVFGDGGSLDHDSPEKDAAGGGDRDGGRDVTAGRDSYEAGRDINIWRFDGVGPREPALSR